MDTSKNLARLFIHFFWLLPVAAVLVLVATTSNAASPQALDALSSNVVLEYAPDSVLVKFKPSASPTQKQNARTLVSGQIMRGYRLVQGLEHMQIGKGLGVEKAIERLQQLPFVKYAEPDYVLRADTNDTLYTLQWGLNNTGQDILGVIGTNDADIDAEEAWTITTGDPTLVVAVIDTGVEYTHEDLINNAWRNPGEIPGNNTDDDGNGYIDDIYGWDFFSSDNNPMDEEGHGTHVAGTICAEGNNGIGVSGVAWQCKIMALRFIGPDGGWTSDAILALEYAVDQGVRVSNNSWGGGGYSTSLKNAIANAGSAGHLFVAAAGNGGTDGIGDDTDIVPHYPSSYDLGNIISVAATDNRDRLAGFSNYGLISVDLGAPGVDIASSMLSEYYWNSGTSMAAPHVSGVAALILDLHPEFTNTEVKDRILSTTRPIDALNGKTVTGGVVNAFAALAGGGECGDGAVDAGEECDDGAANGTTTCGCQADCTYTTAGTSCADGEYCNGEEICDGAGICQAGTAIDCNDGIGCTDDSCDEDNDTCVNAANDANCLDDGQFCTGVEYCDTVTDCDSTGNPCEGGEVCTEATDSCEQPGVCGDGTVDAGEECDDGAANGDDTCGCQADCTYTTAGTSCADGEYCNGDETCDGSGACQAGTAVDCNDGVGCTDDSCDEDNDTCVNAANNANCPDDGQFCTGTEFCDAVNDCSSTGDPCQTGETCNDSVDTCEALTCAEITDKGTCNADPNCEWIGNPVKGSCQDIVVCEPAPEVCGDDVDNDCDGLTDCADTADCSGDPSCQVCDSYPDRKSCQAGGCTWSNKDKVCM